MVSLLLFNIYDNRMGIISFMHFRYGYLYNKQTVFGGGKEFLRTLLGIVIAQYWV